VLVVGAGPAGASAAYFCTQFSDNKEVILLERLNKNKFFSYHEICGEGVSGEFVRDISPFRVRQEHIIEKIKVLEERWPGDIVIETKIDGYIIDRPQLLWDIIGEFRDRGGKLLNDALIDFEQKNKNIKVKLSSGEYIKSKYLIAADGANSKIRKKIGLHGRTKTLVQYIVDEPSPHGRIIFEYDEKWEGDYKWIFPHGKNTKIGFPRVKSIEKVDNIIVKQARRVGFGGIENYVVGNILLVGDAACQNNPLTKGGIRPGMVAGKMAAEAVSNNNPNEYDIKWKHSDFGSPIFLEIYNEIKKMNNEKLKEHIELSQDTLGIILHPNKFLKYRKFYKAYALSNKVGW